jgi:hypothetical protein
MTLDDRLFFQLYARCKMHTPFTPFPIGSWDSPDIRDDPGQRKDGKDDIQPKSGPKTRKNRHFLALFRPKNNAYETKNDGLSLKKLLPCDQLFVHDVRVFMSSN